MQVDDPPYLTVGTAVSAKYKGAFCEAKVRNVVRIVKCKVTYKMGLGTATVTDEQIKGTLRVGHVVQAKHSEKKEYVEATIGKIQDCSQYTVVFDDGDITTLRRTALCLKSGRHFNESETLDQLPLTHPEHFGNPVVGGRRGRRNRQMKEDSSDGEMEEENEPDLEGYSTYIGRVVRVDSNEKKRGKDNWFPGLVVIPSAQPTVRINVKDEYLVRSFRDGRYYTVPKKEITEFSREAAEKVESSGLAEAISKAIKYLDNNELPDHWEGNSLFNIQQIESDSDENFSDSSDDEPCEEKDRFVAQLYKFMDDSGTPLNKGPMIGNKDVDLHRLFRVVHKLGGYNRVTNQNKWRSVSNRLRLPNNQNTFNQVKQVYKKCLLTYESFYRTLGVTMLNHTRSTKKNRGRSLIRDKDRSTPVNNSPKPEKEEDVVEKKEEEKIPVDKLKKKIEIKIEDDKKRKEVNETNSDTNSSDSTEPYETVASTSKDLGRPRRVEKAKDIKKVKAIPCESQQTRSKVKVRDGQNSPERKKNDKSQTKTPKKADEEKKRGRKKLSPEEKSDLDLNQVQQTQSINIGDKLKVYYGPTHESKVTYEAKVIEIDKDATGPVYLVHYTGWNTRYDEWIISNRIAENLSATTKAKRLNKQQIGGNAKQNAAAKNSGVGKRGRGISITGRSTAEATPRSTTPSSITSSSSRTKSPATPATRSTSRMTRQDYSRKTRRTSAQTDVSNHSESESEISESESELSRTRSGNRNEDDAPKTYKKKTGKKEEEKHEEIRKSKVRRKKSPEKSAGESEEETANPPKGRDFDLNQIRSELKGFSKAIKVSVDSGDKEGLSSSDDSTILPNKSEDTDDKKLEKSPTSEDIYEFKEPEPFEFESRKLVDDKSKKRLVPRLFEDFDKSPKKTIKSPGKNDKESPDLERKRYRRTPVKNEDEGTKEEDPFDKLVESPSFNIGKPSDKIPENKQQLVNRNILDEPLNLFRELPETVDDYSRDMDLSDTESQTQPIFSREGELFSDTFEKSSPDRNTLDLGFSKSEESKQKDTDDECDSIRESIQRVIARGSSTDDDSNDALLITPSTSSYQAKKRDPEAKNLLINTSQISDEVKPEPPEISTDIKEDIVKSPVFNTISPALQETDSSLLESICLKPVLLATNLEETKDLNVKTGTKIADSILQKFNSIKSKEDIKEESDKEDMKVDNDKKIDLNKDDNDETKSCADEKKKRRVLSRTYIEESDSDSSDSEQLVIARSDEDSQSNSLDKHDMKESDSNLSVAQATDDSQSHEEQRNFKFDNTVSNKSLSSVTTIKEEVKMENQDIKEEEPDSHLHSLLLCEETLPPRSPAPVSEAPSEQKLNKPSISNKISEMPFASAPGSSNNKNILLNNENKLKSQPPPLVIPLDNSREISAVIDNTPPTTPESTMSNLSPRGDHCGLSPNTAENDSGKSDDAEFCASRKRRNSSNIKVQPYSEEDTQMTNEPLAKKTRDDNIPAPCKKRRKSSRGNDEIPNKRGRKPLNRSRHNSDSDDTSEHSVAGITNLGLNTFDRTSRSPRPSKYNFFVEFDPSLNSGQRIAVLQQKLSELRKTYADVKAELAAVERRRKKIRRREREALKASKQEMACA